MLFSRDVGTLQDVIEYFNAHPGLFEREDYDKGHMERVMAILTQQNMEHLEKEFQLYSRGLELPTFIYLIKKLYIPDHEISKYFFVSDLIKFFQAIDINGDGHLEWSQFTEYIIENIRVVEKPKYKNKVYEENEIISSAYSKISNEYKVNKVYDIQCQTNIRKIVYLDEAKQYFVIENQACSIKIYNRSFQLQDSINLQPQSSKSTIADFSIDKDSCIVGCIFEESLFFTNIKIKTAVIFLNQENSVNYRDFNKIEYLPNHKIWAMTSKTGEIRLATVNYTSRTLMTFRLVKVLNHHESTITDIIEIDEPRCIASSSMDGHIKLYSKYLDKCYTFEHIAEQTSSVINERKKKGILGIGYSSQFGNYMLAFGFSNQVLIYSLDISVTKGFAGKYTEHTGTIMWAKFLKSYPYVLSFDDKLILRIWDFRKFQTIQFINCEKIFINPTRLEVIPQLFEILICEKKITQFRAPALQKKSKEINQFHNIFDFKFCPLTNQIFVFTSNDVRVYNYFTGSLKKLFTRLFSSNYETNITACEFGFKCRRFFIGDAGGFVREFCSETGEELQNINPGEQLNYENKQIVKIMFMKEHSLLVCCSLDGRIMIYERNEAGQFTIARDLRQCHEEFVCGAVSSRYCLLATAGEDGTMVIWNLEKYTMECVFVLGARPVAAVFSPIHPLLVVATEDGFINFFSLSINQGRDKYKCLGKVSIFDNFDTEPDTRITSFCCQLIINAYFPKNCLLTEHVPGNHHLIAAVGTSTGAIHVINLNKMLQLCHVEQNHQIHSIRSSNRCEVQAMKGTIRNERQKVLGVGYSTNNGQVRHLGEFVHFSINAADGPIENLLISKQSSAVFSKSVDKKLKVWSFKSDYNGAINFLTFKKIFWKIPEVNFYKKLQAIDTTIYSIKLIENKKFQPAEETRIKVHLLLNEYLNNKQKEHYINWLAAKNHKEEPAVFSKPKARKPEQDGSLSEQEFNQIYSKLKMSIQKSLEDYRNTEKIFWDKNNPGQIHNKSKVKVGKLVHTLEFDDNELISEQMYKCKPLLNKKSRKYDACFELFGHKAKKTQKKPQSKRKDLLFTPLSTAKKCILSTTATSSPISYR